VGGGWGRARGNWWRWERGENSYMVGNNGKRDKAIDKGL